MSKTLLIAASNFLPMYKTSSLEIREIIQNKSNVATMQLVGGVGDDVPQEGSEIVFKDGSRFLFGGFISRVQSNEVGKGSMFIYDIEASDYSYIFNSKIARRAYINKTLKYIVEDLMGTYIDASYGFTTTNVDTGPTIPSITFDHVSVRKCFEKLQKLTGYVWYTDYEKNLFFKQSTADPAPEQITDTSGNYQSISIAYDTSQCRNSVIVIGSENGEQSASSQTESFTGDGETRSWVLEDKPSEIISIKVNGVSQQFSLDLNERDTDYFVYSFGDAQIRLTATPVTPTGSDTVTVEYYPRIPIISEKQDQDSIDFFSAKDGGDGVMEYTIKEPSITSKSEAADRAVRELEEYSMPLVNGKFRTRTGLLSGGSIFQAGQYVTINLPSWGISSDAAFLIQEVNISLDETASTTEYIYDVRFGGKLTGVREFLEGLASDQTEEVSDVDKILTIEHTIDSVELEDTTPTRALFTPPFKWGGLSAAIDSYSESNRNTGLKLYTASNVGQSFNAGSSGSLRAIKAHLKRTGSPTGTCKMLLYAHTGTYGTSGLPTGPILAESDPINVSTIPTADYALTQFNFWGSNQKALVSGTKYVAFLQYLGGDLTTNYIAWGADSSAPTHGGNVVEYDGATWTAYTIYDLCFYVYLKAVANTGRWNLSEWKS